MNRVSAAVAALSLVLGSTAANAGSCWDHNGSLMRMVTIKQGRDATVLLNYERPRSNIRAQGVRRGWTLFTGVKRGGYLTGTARAFSRQCPQDPKNFDVRGPDTRDSDELILEGYRPVREMDCTPTERARRTVLRFTNPRPC